MNTHLPWGTIRSWANDSKIHTEVDHTAHYSQTKANVRRQNHAVGYGLNPVRFISEVFWYLVGS